jgi:peptidoglycan hydrolase CwlO-like protein
MHVLRERVPTARHRAFGLFAVALTALALLGTGLTASTSASLQGQISAKQSAVAALKSAIASETAQIASTDNGIARARARLASLQRELATRIAQLEAVQGELLRAHVRLVKLENRLEQATHALAGNLVVQYEQGSPDLMTALLESNGFSDLLNRINFLERFAQEDSHVVGTTRAARNAVAAEANRLAALERRDRQLADQVISERNQEAALKAALLSRQLAETRARAKNGARLQTTQSQLRSLQHQLAVQEARAAAAAAAAANGNASVGGIPIATHGMVQPPAGAPEAVVRVIAAGNAIATLPYIWGGGHASFQANGYDCSGSVSYALAAAGLVSSPMTSGMFMNWGAPGPGRWITVYANATHVWMEVAGWRFDTVALAEDGTRWSRGGGEFAGFVVRHPPGL